MCKALRRCIRAGGLTQARQRRVSFPESNITIHVDNPRPLGSFIKGQNMLPAPCTLDLPVSRAQNQKKQDPVTASSTSLWVKLGLCLGGCAGWERTMRRKVRDGRKQCVQQKTQFDPPKSLGTRGELPSESSELSIGKLSSPDDEHGHSRVEEENVKLQFIISAYMYLQIQWQMLHGQYCKPQEISYARWVWRF